MPQRTGTDGATGAYREYPPPRGLETYVACVWRSDDRAVNVLPDGCVDIVFEAGGLVVAGPATAARLSSATPDQGRVGLRFRIGLAGPALGVPVDQLRDTNVDLRELWGPSARRLEDRVAGAPDTHSAIATLAAGVGDTIARPVTGDPAVRAVVRGRPAPAPSLDRLAREHGLSERHLRRRIERSVGYGPATLRRVQRFQRFLGVARASPGQVTLARLAAEAGYADQAHLAREARRLSGLPPSRLLATGARPAGERSERFKPAGSAMTTLGP